MKTFEDIIAWQKARELTNGIYEVTRLSPLSDDRGLAGQMQRSAVSIMANVAEGFERGSKAEFARFLAMAKGSCAEVRSHLYVALDLGYVTEEQFQKLSSLATEVKRLVGALRASLK